jgi:hypothetical protein
MRDPILTEGGEVDIHASVDRDIASGGTTDRGTLEYLYLIGTLEETSTIEGKMTILVNFLEDADLSLSSGKEHYPPNLLIPYCFDMQVDGKNVFTEEMVPSLVKYIAGFNMCRIFSRLFDGSGLTQKDFPKVYANAVKGDLQKILNLSPSSATPELLEIFNSGGGLHWEIDQYGHDDNEKMIILVESLLVEIHEACNSVIKEFGKDYEASLGSRNSQEE